MDIGDGVHYMAVPRGAAVFSSDGRRVGSVVEMLDNYREHIFDGVIFRDDGRALRFVDAPEVARTGERGVQLAIDAEAASRLQPPERGQGSMRTSMEAGLGRLFGIGRRRD